MIPFLLAVSGDAILVWGGSIPMDEVRTDKKS
jgi:hypothetical protein